MLSRDRCNIVIDPPNPAAAPYIVITPLPHDSQWADYHAWFHNTITPQWTEYLVVPQVSLGVASIHPLQCTTPTQDIESLPPTNATGDSSSMRPVSPPTCFNHSVRLLRLASIVPHSRIPYQANWTYLDKRKEKLIVTLYRHCYKSSVSLRIFLLSMTYLTILRRLIPQHTVLVHLPLIPALPSSLYLDTNLSSGQIQQIHFLQMCAGSAGSLYSNRSHLALCLTLLSSTNLLRILGSHGPTRLYSRILRVATG